MGRILGGLVVAVLLTLLADPLGAAADDSRVEQLRSLPGPSLPSDITAAQVVRMTLPITYQSQLAEPPPSDWQDAGTPYCVPAAATMLLRERGVKLPGAVLSTLYEQGRRYNSTPDAGIDPDGLSRLLQAYGGNGTIHLSSDRGVLLDDLVGRLNWNAPSIAFTQGGLHVAVVYGYEAQMGGPITGLYLADPYNGFSGLVRISDFWESPNWMGQPFRAPGWQWQEQWVFVSYKDYVAIPAALR